MVAAVAVMAAGVLAEVAVAPAVVLQPHGQVVSIIVMHGVKILMQVAVTFITTCILLFPHKVIARKY